MKKRILLGSIFVIFILLVSPSIKAVECLNSIQTVKDELYETVSKSNIDGTLKNNILQRLDQIEEIDSDTFSLFKKFNSLYKTNTLDGYNYFLTLAMINFLWSLYYIIAGDMESARLHLQIAILCLIMFVLVNQ